MDQAEIELSAAASFIMLDLYQRRACSYVSVSPFKGSPLLCVQCQAAGRRVQHPESYRGKETEDEHAGEVKDGLGRF